MKSIATITAFLVIFSSPLKAEEHDGLPYLLTDMIDTTNVETLGLTMAAETKTITIFCPSDTTHHYANGVVMTAFKGTLYCMWQSSLTDEDAPETCVMMSKSVDEGMSWTRPELLASATDSSYCTSGGWISTEDTLTAFINVWPKHMQPVGGYTYYMISKDGEAWSDPEPVMMADGQPMAGVIEQDPYPLPNGRVVGAAHFLPGLHVNPIFTDDPTGRSGWQKAEFNGHDKGKQSQELEPSLYQQQDGTLVMMFRDQNSSYRKMASLSHDGGKTWTEPIVTNILDARMKQSAGNLPDGTAYLVGCPTGSKRRYPLVALFSGDGIRFDNAILLRAGGSDLQPQRYPGKAKTIGYSYPKSMVYNDKLYVCYSTNKEEVECTIISIK